MKSLQPSTVQQASGSEYQVMYDGSGRLASIAMPSGEQHSWRLLQEPGLRLLLRTAPLSQLPFAEGRDAQGRPLFFGTPEALRRAHWLHFNRSTLLVDGLGRNETRTVDEAGRLVAVEARDEGGVWRKTLTWLGPLPASLVEEQSGYSAAFAYQYDDLLRLTSLALTLNGRKSLAPLRFHYDPDTGRIAKIRDAAVQYSGMSLPTPFHEMPL